MSQGWACLAIYLVVTWVIHAIVLRIFWPTLRPAEKGEALACLFFGAWLCAPAALCVGIGMLWQMLWSRVFSDPEPDAVDLEQGTYTMPEEPQPLGRTRRNIRVRRRDDD